MADYTTTTKFAVDISELKKAMQEAKRQVAVANSEFKAVSSSMDDWTKSTDGISAKLKQLDSNLKSQKTILGSLEEQYERTVKEMGEGSKAADDLKIKINNQKAVINSTEKEIGKYNEELSKVSEAEKEAAKSGKSVAEVLDDIEKKANEAGDGFTVMKGAVATFVGNALTSLVGGLRDAASNLLGLAESTQEYREQMNKISSASEEAGYGVEYAKEKYEDLYGVLGDETAATTTMSNFMAMGAETDTLNSLLDSSVGIWAKFGDSIPLDGLAEAINHSSKLGSVQGNLADALEWSGITVEDFNAQLEKCSTEQERQELIADTLSGIYGDLSTSYKENNASIIESRKAQADYTDTLAQMGEKIEPVTTALKNGFTDLLNKVLGLTEGVDIDPFVTGIQDGFGYLKDEILPKVVEGFQWIKDNGETIVGVITAIGAGFVAWNVVTMIQGVVGAIKAFKIANDGLKISQIALNAVMAANPIGIVIAAITALVAAFIYLWNTSDEFKQFWLDLWENIKSAISTAKEWIGGKIEEIGKFFTETIPAFLDKAVQFFSELPSKIWTWLVETITKIEQWKAQMVQKAIEVASNFINKVVEYVKQLPSKIWTWLVNTITKLNKWKTDMGQKGKEAITELVNKVLDGAKSIPEKMLSIGKNIVDGVWQGIKDAKDKFFENVKGFFSGLVDGAKEALDINSPSKVFAKEIGRWIPEGIAVGIDKNAKSALNSMKNLTTGLVYDTRSNLSSGGGGSVGGANFVQNIYSPKPLSRLEIYRQSKNLLGYAGGV